MKDKKAQSSIEFLFTYGWAILAITLTISTLAYFNLFSAERFVSPYCDLGSQFQCIEYAIYDNGSIVLFIRNNHRVDIELNNLTLDSRYFNHLESFTTISISRGDVESITINIEDDVFEFESSLQLNLKLSYNRLGGSNNYVVSGQLFTPILNS